MTPDYDRLLDPPDDDVCETHDHLLPCWACKVDDADEKAEWQMEREALEL